MDGVTVLKTHISWTNSTWNPWVGCKPVSEGCRNCYAAAIVHRWGQRFEDVKLHLDRLPQIKRFRPVVGEGGRLAPHMVFVNSMSDFFYEPVPDEAIYQTLDAIEAAPNTVFQILSKRPVRARQIITSRFGNRGVPEHIWFGFSAEDNQVAGRIKILRSIKERVGNMVAFLSVEPIVGPTDSMDFSDIDWIITGGESGPRARVMQRDWLLPAIENATKAGAAIWHKQNGQIRSHPNLAEAPAELGITARFRWLCEYGREVLPQEKGGATVDGQTYRSLPPAYHRIAERLNAPV